MANIMAMLKNWAKSWSKNQSQTLAQNWIEFKTGEVGFVTSRAGLMLVVHLSDGTGVRLMRHCDAADTTTFEQIWNKLNTDKMTWSDGTPITAEHLRNF